MLEQVRAREVRLPAAGDNRFRNGCKIISPESIHVLSVLQVVDYGICMTEPGASAHCQQVPMSNGHL